MISLETAKKMFGKFKKKIINSPEKYRKALKSQQKLRKVWNNPNKFGATP